MKSKRRHELQTNELADRIGSWIEKIRPHLTTMALGVVVAAVLLGVWYYWASSKEMLVTQAWRTYMLAGSNPQGDFVKELEAVADNFDDTKAGLWAAQTAADIEAAQGVRMLFQDTSKAEDYLENAIGGYRRVLESELIKNSPMLQRRAHFGLAQALEAIGKLDEAMKHYEAVVAADKDSSLGEVAQRHVERLSKESTQTWYTWFEQQEPTVPESDATGVPGADLGLSRDELETLPEGPTSDFMLEPDASEVPADDSTATQGDSATPAEDGSSTENDQTAAEPQADGPVVDPPQSAAPQSEPAKTEPAKTEPAKTEPAKTEPAKTEPAKTEPAKTEPAKTD